MMRTLHTVLGDRWALASDGRPADPGASKHSPPTWRIVGAVQHGRGGGVLARYDLETVLRDPRAIPWHWINGAQRTYLQLLDRGWLVELRSPVHWIT